MRQIVLLESVVRDMLDSGFPGSKITRQILVEWPEMDMVEITIVRQPVTMEREWQRGEGY